MNMNKRLLNSVKRRHFSRFIAQMLEESMDKEIGYGHDYHYIPATSIGSGIGMEWAHDVYCYTIQIVNIALVGQPNTDQFVLVDAGMPQSAEKIMSVVEERFGKNRRPNAILLTHGHFDHVGALVDLVKYWDVPVYAHELEFPYLTGQERYPEPDPTVEGGLVAKMSPMFPNDPIDVRPFLHPLPSDHSIPHMPGFRWIFTPGHSPGHVSFFRESDRMLIAGDAFVTVRQEYLYQVMTQEKEISGPPRYFTTDWQKAKTSVEILHSLQPNVALPGHGVPMEGEKLQKNLKRLVDQFEQIAVPDYGKYVDH